ncbi:metallophosphoesterase family protein [Nannocystis pusilla]|uniref:metallophosphoesterase family protein n=1 Tax=Nannocystis pusilla TaxID=889268 RepID=UPI003B7EED09
MKLWALSDLHVGHRRNRELLENLSPRPGDWLIVGGDVGETGDHMQWAFDLLQPRFARLLWVPGNHELWTTEERGVRLGGADKLAALCELCRSRGVVSVDDPWPVWPGDGGPHTLALLALLYDYTFAPAGMDRAAAIAWAADDGVLAADEARLDPRPFADIVAWSAERVRTAAARLELARAHPTILVNHWPLRDDLIFIPRVPRYRPWCGTRATHDWHRRYGARGRQRPLAHAAHRLDRRRALRGGLARLSARATARHARRRLSAPDLARADGLHYRAALKRRTRMSARNTPHPCERCRGRAARVSCAHEPGGGLRRVPARRGLPARRRRRRRPRVQVRGPLLLRHRRRRRPAVLPPRVPQLWGLESEAERHWARIAAAEVTAEFKVVKVYPQHDDMQAATELFLAAEGDFRLVFERCIAALQGAVRRFCELMERGPRLRLVEET